MTHTPGPWTVKPYVYVKRGESRTRPAAVIAGNHWICDGVMGHDFKGSSLANAALIAAAPDMLAALKEAEDAVMFVRDQFLVHSAPHRDGLRGWTALQETIQAAIAKATAQS